MWDDLLGRVKAPVVKAARTVINVNLSDRAQERERAAMRNRRWRKRHRAELKRREAKRREVRGALYRAGGKYYEARKADPEDRALQRERQRVARRS